MMTVKSSTNVKPVDRTRIRRNSQSHHQPPGQEQSRRRHSAGASTECVVVGGLFSVTFRLNGRRHLTHLSEGSGRTTQFAVLA